MQPQTTITLAQRYSHISYTDTGYFSKLVNDYTDGNPVTKPFYEYAPDAPGLAQAIAARKVFPVNRDVLVSVLREQYKDLQISDATEQNLQLLLSENTFTITTAHQPNLLTGYLYFIYKILHAIKLAEDLNKQHPGQRFVPVYYMGSEDNDIEELGVFRFRGEKHVWDGDGQKGAVGRMNTVGLKPLLGKLFSLLGPPGAHCNDLEEMIRRAYLQHKTIAAATQYLVNELFGKYGLIVLDPDSRALKATFLSVMEDELLYSHAYPIISAQSERLEAHYKAQMFPRPINLFYLDDQIRERIERQGDQWVVLNTDVVFTRQEILETLHREPEKFSPNVALRGLFQETILPDVAFIGGGAEVAYWMQLKTVFAHYGIFFPALILRQSVLWIDEPKGVLRGQSETAVNTLFKQQDILARDYVLAHGSNEWQTGGEAAEIEAIFARLKDKATALDPTLNAAAGAAFAKMKHQLATLEKKMLRAEKRKMEVGLNRIFRLKDSLFPNNSLQERVENFMEYYLQYGPEFFQAIKDGIAPLSGKFMIVEVTTD